MCNRFLLQLGTYRLLPLILRTHPHIPKQVKQGTKQSYFQRAYAGKTTN